MSSEASPPGHHSTKAREVWYSNAPHLDAYASLCTALAQLEAQTRNYGAAKRSAAAALVAIKQAEAAQKDERQSVQTSAPPSAAVVLPFPGCLKEAMPKFTRRGRLPRGVELLAKKRQEVAVRKLEIASMERVVGHLRLMLSRSEGFQDSLRDRLASGDDQLRILKGEAAT